MRNINRIKPFLNELEKLWEAYPDLRFGQLVYLLAEKLDCDIFFPEEERWLEVIRETKRPDYSNYALIRVKNAQNDTN